MNDERLDELLREADADVTTPAIAPGLSARVRRLARRRSQIRAAGAASALMLVVGAGFFMVARPTSRIARKVEPHVAPHPVDLLPAAVQADPARLRAEYVMLCAEAKNHERAASLIMQNRAAAEQRAWVIATLAKPSATEELAAQRNRAARILLDYGDSLPPDPSGRAEASAAYRQAATLFPESPAGVDARKRLERMKA